MLTIVLGLYKGSEQMRDDLQNVVCWGEGLRGELGAEVVPPNYSRRLFNCCGVFEQDAQAARCKSILWKFALRDLSGKPGCLQ